MNRLVEPIGRVLDRAPRSWAPVLDAWRASEAGRALEAFVADRQRTGATIYPARVLHALELTPLEAVKVVILGQDPYHGAGQAEGLAFSVPRGVRPPPSLRNIFLERQRDLGLPLPTHGHLGAWARLGVLLLNTSLTVEDGAPAAHAGRGWEALTDEIIKAVVGSNRPTVFLLWGAHAQSRGASIADGRGHTVLTANHPSPLSARRGPQPFLGCGHFSAANRALTEAGRGSIDWRLDGETGSR